MPTGRNANSTDGLDHGNGVICRGGGTNNGSGTLPSSLTRPGATASMPSTSGPYTTTNTDIRDGTSKTFLAGESVPAWCNWSVWMWFDGSTATCGMAMNYFNNPNYLQGQPRIDPTANATNWQLSYGFMSRHTVGCNMAMCDGSVKFIADSIDMPTYQALATIDGREPVEVP